MLTGGRSRDCCQLLRRRIVQSLAASTRFTSAGCRQLPYRHSARSFARTGLMWDHKGAKDGAKAQKTSKLCAAVWAAAKDGGTDPKTNQRLSIAIANAKAGNVPKSNIERAMSRAESTDDQMEAAQYELVGPAGIGLLVLAATDNRSRMSQGLKAACNKHPPAALAATGAVLWQFEQRGLLQCMAPQGTPGGSGLDDMMELAIEHGATDFEEPPQDVVTAGGATNDDGVAVASVDASVVAARGLCSIICEPGDLGSLCKAMIAGGHKVVEFNRIWEPTHTIPLAVGSHEEDALVGLLAELQELEDVTEVFHNAVF